jgi:transposase
MDRFCLTDAQWAKMELHCLGKPSDPGRTGGDNRLFVEAVLWIARTGSPWQDLPSLFGKWNTVFQRGGSGNLNARDKWNSRLRSA